MTSVPLASVAAIVAPPIVFVGNGNNSTNWSGYAITGAAGSISIAQGAWVVPKVTCASSETSYSAFWVGIDGFTSTTVEQTGTDSDCHSGVPTYYAWFEFFPKPSRTIASMVVHSGDVIAARVSYAAGMFRVTIQDTTSGKTFTSTSAVSGAARSSAEFVVEAPAICSIIHCKLASLSNFGTTGFGADNTGIAGFDCAVAVNGVLADIGTYGTTIQEITMVSQSNSAVIKSLPSAISADGTSFTVQWMNAGP
ncbi:MAG TPA: G1 family glutamic endopeptidase [Nitrospira sp.]|nr:G1 family glutamic endopeptidase [Nitrospira sp.]